MVVLAVGATIFFSGGRAGAEIVLSIVYDNAPYKAGLTPDWGFSCLIKAGGKRILFDTGKDGELLLENFRKMGERPEELDCVVLSHNHQDHIGGLPAILEVNPEVRVCLCDPTLEMVDMCRASKAVVFKTAGPQPLWRGIYLTGGLGKGIKEQALFLNTQAGLIIVAGCSHPGILSIVESIRNLLPRPVFLVLGGFHTTPTTLDGLQRMVFRFRSLGVRRLAPCHCTDPAAKATLKSLYGKNYIRAGVGRVIRLPFDLR